MAKVAALKAKTANAQHMKSSKQMSHKGKAVETGLGSQQEERSHWTEENEDDQDNPWWPKSPTLVATY